MSLKKPNVSGGGAKTNLHGLTFEQTTQLRDAIKMADPTLELKGDDLYRAGKKIATFYEKEKLYSKLLESKGINYKQILSKKLIPDDAILVGGVLFIVEKKFQKVAGSVDEKLQTCHFKKRQYDKLLKPAKISVVYAYFLNDWFHRPEYRDVLQYIKDVGCRYYFDSIPLKDLGLD